MKVIEGGFGKPVENETPEIPEVALDAIFQYFSKSEEAMSLCTEDVMGFALVLQRPDGYVIMGDVNSPSDLACLLDKAKLSLYFREMVGGEFHED